MKMNLARIFTMTCFLAIAVTPTAACHAWLNVWLDHSGELPNRSHTHGASTWAVIANFGTGMQIIHGESRCVNTTGNNHRCDRRRLSTEWGSWSRSYSSAHGSGTENCSGTGSSSCVGQWIQLYTFGLVPSCATYCASHCAHCVGLGSFILCTRAAVLAQ